MESYRWRPLTRRPEPPDRQRTETNISFTLLGYIPSVYTYYRENPVDIFINTSSSEGIPVTIMEAISCGIPIIATDVGGNPEIVGEECGIIIPADPKPADIAEAVLRMISDQSGYQKKKAGCINIWSSLFNAEKNYRNFGIRLQELFYSHDLK